MKKTFNNILIVGHSNIGDVCYDLVIIHPLKSAFPNAKISYLTSSRSDNIPKNWRGVDHVITFNKKDDKKLWGRLPFILKLRKKRFDLVIVLKSSMMHHLLGIPTAWDLKKFLGGKKSSNHNKHVIDIYLDFLKSHEIQNSRASFDIEFDKKTIEFCNQFLSKNNIQLTDKMIGISPTAAWTVKNWPIAKWNTLSNKLKEKGYKTIAFGKLMDDGPFSKQVASQMSPEIISAMDKTSLVEALALIKRCKAFIGPDSSLLHLASCMKVETFGVYGATDKDYIYPYFHRGNIINSKSNIPCMPCYPPGNIPCQRMQLSFCGQCMDEISVEEVLKKLEPALS